MSNFTAILKDSIVASSESGVIKTDGFINIIGTEFLAKLQCVPIGDKDGSHFLRTGLKMADGGARCLSRNDNNIQSMASLLPIDCDKRVDSDGQELEGAPDPVLMSQVLMRMGIGHVIYGSHSHYGGNKGNRYRILLVTALPYAKEQLAPTIEGIISLINANLDGALLDYATENNTFSQPWYYPRKPAGSHIETFYTEYLEGRAVDVVNPFSALPPVTHTLKRSNQMNAGEISPIDAFNEQNNLMDCLLGYGC